MLIAELANVGSGWHSTKSKGQVQKLWLSVCEALVALPFSRPCLMEALLRYPPARWSGG